MGCFTSIRHPVDGREIQIKTGDDVCAWFNVGDELYWEPTEWNVGEHIDGIHDGISNPDCLVVIKNKRIVWVEDRVFSGFRHNDERADTLTQEQIDDLYDEDWKQQCALRDRFEIKAPDESLWPERWWRAKRERSERYAREHEEMIAKDKAAGIDTTTLGYMMSMPIRRNLDYAGVANRVLVVDQMAAK